MKQNTRIYSDFDINFTAHPLTGDISMKYNESAIKQSIRNLVMYKKHEKPFEPELNGGIHEMLFEPMGRNTAIGIESRLEYLIKQYEPRCELMDIDVEPDYAKNQYNVTITYKIKNQLEPIKQKIFLQRVR